MDAKDTLQVFDSNAMPWEERFIPELGKALFAKRFLETWMNSRPHRDNFAFADYDRTGVGAAVNGDTVYVAQLFATDMGMPPLKDGAPPGTVTTYDSAAAAADEKQRAPDPLRLRGPLGAPSQPAAPVPPLPR